MLLEEKNVIYIINTSLKNTIYSYWRNIYFNFLIISVSRGSKITEHIIIGTPGKVLDWAVKFKFFSLNKISVFVLDEADVMIATQGHQDQCIRIHK